MTYRTFDIDNGIVAGGATPSTEDSNPARHVRSRRRRAVLSYRSTSCRVAGFGI